GAGGGAAADAGHRMPPPPAARRRPRGRPAGAGAIPRLTDDRHVRFGVEDHLESRADQGLVVGEQDPDHFGSTSGCRGAAVMSWSGGRYGLGMAARTRNPPPGCVPVVSRPPSIGTRSRSTLCPPP